MRLYQPGLLEFATIHEHLVDVLAKVAILNDLDNSMFNIWNLVGVNSQGESNDFQAQTESLTPSK